MEIRLPELALACFAFDAITEYNRSLTQLREATVVPADLKRRDHRIHVLKFLRQWGCRHLAVEHAEEHLEALDAWYRAWGTALPPHDAQVWHLSDAQLDRAADAYHALASMPAHSLNTVRGRRQVPIGATAAGKVLFVLCPGSFPPPDDETRKTMKRSGLASNYREIIGWVREQCLALGKECGRRGLELEELPARLDRQDATVVHLVQEYMWVLFTRKADLSRVATVQEWAGSAATRGLE